MKAHSAFGHLSTLERARLALLLMCFACGARAQEPVPPPQPPAESRPTSREPSVKERLPGATQSRTVTLESTAIRGNQELPKVLYIVPWKDPALVELAGRPVNSLVDEVLAPVDREVFRRQGRYFEQLYSDSPGDSVGAAVADSAGK